MESWRRRTAVHYVPHPSYCLRKYQERRPAKSVRAGVTQSNLATQSLSILTVHLPRADHPTEDWVKMVEVMDELETLSEHEDERVSFISSQLYQLIITQKIVINETTNLKQTNSRPVRHYGVKD